MDAIFFPRKDYDVQICPHRLGKKMTYSDGTDTAYMALSYGSYMSMAKQRNIKCSVFLGYDEIINDNLSSVLEDYANKKVWLDIYSLCPSLEAKIISGETITEQEFLYAYNNELKPAFVGLVGKIPVGLGYARSRTNFADYAIEKFLVCRGSEPLTETGKGYEFITDYGINYGSPNTYPYSKNRYKVLTNSDRWYDNAKNDNNNFAGHLQTLSNKIDDTMLNGGWFRNFTHWHNYWQDGNEEWAEEYLDLLASKNQNDEIYFAGYGETVAYLVYRQLITMAVMYSPIGSENERLIIQLEATNTLGLNTELLQIPISIKFSTTGTPLQGQSIKSNCNLVDLGSGEYIVEIPYSRFPRAVIQINPLTD